MPVISFDPKKLEENKPIPDGIYTVLLSGFKPKKSKDGNSINLNPQMKIVNNADHNGRVVFSNLNTNAGWLFESFAKCFGEPGLEMKPNGQPGLPGEFQGPETEPEKWTYIGPLMGRTGNVEAGDVPNKKDPNSPSHNQVKKFIPA